MIQPGDGSIEPTLQHAEIGDVGVGCGRCLVTAFTGIKEIVYRPKVMQDFFDTTKNSQLLIVGGHRRDGALKLRLEQHTPLQASAHLVHPLIVAGQQGAAQVHLAGSLRLRPFHDVGIAIENLEQWGEIAHGMGMLDQCCRIILVGAITPARSRRIEHSGLDQLRNRVAHGNGQRLGCHQGRCLIQPLDNPRLRRGQWINDPVDQRDALGIGAELGQAISKQGLG